MESNCGFDGWLLTQSMALAGEAQQFVQASVASRAGSVGRLGNLCSSVETCNMTSDEKTKGPASYFPSIEKTYGKPVAH